MQNLLTTLKSLNKDMAIALTEASNEKLCQEYQKIFDSVHKSQREVFEVMFQNGWYTLEQAEFVKIQEKSNLLNQEFQNLNN